MKKGLFLDRDGVINKECGAHTVRLADFQILPDVAQAIKAAVGAGWVVIGITNQSGIDLGLYDRQEVERMHHYLHDVLAESGTAMTEILYCPHHPTKGKCLCRKPGSLLLERAAARHGIDLSASIMIGDRERDIQAAAAVGVHGILVEPNTSLLEILRTHRSIA